MHIAHAKLHEAKTEEVHRDELSREVMDLKKELQHSRDSAIEKLTNKLDRRDAELHAAKAQDEAQDAQASDARTKVFSLRRETEQLRRRLADKNEDLKEAWSEERAEEKTLKQASRQRDGPEKEPCLDANFDTTWQHDEELQRKNAHLEKRVSDLRVTAKDAQRAQAAAEERAAAVRESEDKSAEDVTAKLHKIVLADKTTIGQLEGELEISADEEKILQHKLENVESRLIIAQNRMGNHSDVSDKEKNELEARLQVAESRMQVLQGELEEKNGDLVEEQSEVEADKLEKGSGATMEEVELNGLRNKVRALRTRRDVMNTRLQASFVS